MWNYTMGTERVREWDSPEFNNMALSITWGQGWTTVQHWKQLLHKREDQGLEPYVCVAAACIPNRWRQKTRAPPDKMASQMSCFSKPWVCFKDKWAISQVKNGLKKISNIYLQASTFTHLYTFTCAYTYMSMHQTCATRISLWQDQ